MVVENRVGPNVVQPTNVHLLVGIVQLNHYFNLGIPEYQSQAVATSALWILALSLSYEMREDFVKFKFYETS